MRPGIVGEPAAGEEAARSAGTQRQTLPAAEPGGPAAAVLRVADLHKEFRSGFLRRRIRGIEGVSFSVAQGTIFALLGHNGAGKTTTINCILDLVRPDAGEVVIQGRDHRDSRSRARVGYLPERPYFFEHLSGRELLQFYADLLGVPRSVRAGRIAAVLDQVGMSSYAARRLGKYSKGMLQRIGLAQALLGDPDLLILDEPMSGLDPIGRREVRRLLLDLRRAGKTIILSSHIVPDIESLADEVAVLKDGRLVANCRMSELCAGSAYRVNLAADSRADLQGRDCRCDGDTLRMEAADVDQLRSLLAECHAQGRKVMSVETINSGLEDLFLRTNAGQGVGS